MARIHIDYKGDKEESFDTQDENFWEHQSCKFLLDSVTDLEEMRHALFLHDDEIEEVEYEGEEVSRVTAESILESELDDILDAVADTC